VSVADRVLSVANRERDIVRAVLALGLVTGGCVAAAYGLSGPRCGHDTHGEWLFVSSFLFAGVVFLILQRLLVRLWLAAAVGSIVGMAVGGALLIFSLAAWFSHCTA
jgi:hypothetical protein